ncbi:MAG: hypothetical protein V7K77_30600 [Nostoc sp.]|uniref:hypothetical protein n=1 Tax=Nostoc sp. TaxID=1180 RepID=UPI002FFA119D
MSRVADGLTPLVVRQPKIARWRSAEEQGSRGAEERFIQVLSPLPLRTSTPLLATMQNSLGRLLVLRSSFSAVADLSRSSALLRRRMHR